ncbi:MAG: hypothetical protein K2X99_05520 [Gemmatimonadaceae bacterium]|nr:hypothetical protein [Gemmatimonadaceae bacterium]
MRRPLLSLLLALGATALPAQIITVRVLDSRTSGPIQYARVTAERIGCPRPQDSTDVNGAVRLRVPGGRRTWVCISKIGFTPETVSFATPKIDTTLIFQLNPQVITLEERRIIARQDVFGIRMDGLDVRFLSDSMIERIRPRSIHYKDFVRELNVPGLYMNTQSTTCIQFREGCSLLLLDGVEVPPEYVIEPALIKDVGFMRPTDARAIWGPRGYFGAVLIRTRETPWKRNSSKP